MRTPPPLGSTLHRGPVVQRLNTGSPEVRGFKSRLVHWKEQQVGRTQQSLTVIALTSSHNSEQDLTDANLWDDLYARVKALIEEDKYEQIAAMLI